MSADPYTQMAIHSLLKVRDYYRDTIANIDAGKFCVMNGKADYTIKYRAWCAKGLADATKQLAEIEAAGDTHDPSS